MSVFEALMELEPALIKFYSIVKKEENQEVRDAMLLVIAGDVLHDVSEERRNKFFAEYDALRESVCEMIGES